MTTHIGSGLLVGPCIQEQLRAVQQALKANFEPDGKLMDAERRELTEKQERLREKRRERDAAAPAAARAHASVSSLRASLSEDLRKRQDEFKEAHKDAERQRASKVRCGGVGWRYEGEWQSSHPFPPPKSRI